MFNRLATAWLRWWGGTPAFRVWGRSRREKTWRVLEVFATHRRDADSRWPVPFWRGTCITWTASVIAVGWDFAEEVLREQADDPASRLRPVEVAGGRLNDLSRRSAVAAAPWPSASEVLAHECGHTAQALRLGLLYLPTGALFTLFREGEGWCHRFENEASEGGQFGGIVNASVHPSLMDRLQLRRRRPAPTPAG
jgi:hypothetical protein